MTRNVKMLNDGNCYYMVQDISGLGIYDKSKAIVDFCDKETKEFEKVIDRAIMDIFTRHGINIANTKKSVLKKAFQLLKSKGYDIKITNLYDTDVRNIDSCEKMLETDMFTIWLERDHISDYLLEILQCGVMVEEIKLKGRFLI